MNGWIVLTEACCCAQVYGRSYYRVDHYISKSVMEKRALPSIKDELLRLHASNTQMLSDESELEFLKVTRQKTLMLVYMYINIENYHLIIII